MSLIIFIGCGGAPSLETTLPTETTDPTETTSVSESIGVGKIADDLLPAFFSCDSEYLVSYFVFLNPIDIDAASEEFRQTGSVLYYYLDQDRYADYVQLLYGNDPDRLEVEIAAYAQHRLEAIKAITTSMLDSFVERHGLEGDVILYQSEYTTTLIVVTTVAKLIELADDPDVVELSRYEDDDLQNE